MTPTSRTIALAMCAGLALAACGKKASTSPPGSSGAPSGTPATATVQTMSVSGVGTVLVAGNGRTLYALTADQGGNPTCAASATCRGAWPPLLLPTGTTAPQGSAGVTSSMLGTVKDPNGQTQVTYNSWPLYMFSGDSGPGQSNGEGIVSFGGTWYAMGLSGAPVKPSGSSSNGGY
jgi:predicted lipoprotein with Yx(FWY)xxD motif